MTTFSGAFKLSNAEVEAAMPPGTVELIDHADVEAGHIKDGHIQLQPSPSADPADPLNWPMYQKIGALLAASLYAFVNNFASAVLTSAFPQIFVFFELKYTFAKLTQLQAVNVLLAGAGNLLWVPLANCYGRRPVILVAVLIMTLTSVWCGEATSFSSLLAGRLFQGLGQAAADGVAPDVVGEIFFVHQRGRAMGFYTFWLAMGSLVGGISGGYIAAQSGWQWTMYYSAILSGITFALTFVMLPESLYRRNNRASSVNSLSPISSKEKSEVVTEEHAQTYAPWTFARSLKFWGQNRGGLFRLFVDPFLTLRYPGVWLIMLLYGGLVGGIVTMSTVAPTLLASPPYLFGANVGLINLGGVAGTFVGGLLTFFTSDKFLKRSARHDRRGLSEPEARLPTMFPGLFLATTGLLVFGFTAANPAPGRWIGLAFGFGMLAAGLVQAPSIGFNYVIESYNSVSGDCLTMIVTFRAVISFAWTFFVGTWIENRGAAEPFGIFAMLLGLFLLLILPQWWYGKRTRIATAKWLPERIDH